MIGTELFFAVVGCVGLWRLWRAVAKSGSAVTATVAGAGFLLRCFVGQAMFWISYLGLPVGKGLQEGGGFWFFGRDAQEYLRQATNLAAGGGAPMFHLTDGFASPFFVQCLALFVMLLGGVSSVALLFNLYCYLAMCLVILRWTRHSAPGKHEAAIVTVAGLAFSPSLILWSLQPLKDTLFVALLVAVVVLVAVWRSAVAERGAGLRILAVSMAIGGCLYGLAGIRAYAAAGIFGAMGVGLMLSWLEVPRERKVAVAIAGVMTVALALAAVMAGGGPYFAEPVQIVKGLGMTLRSVASDRYSVWLQGRTVAFQRPSAAQPASSRETKEQGKVIEQAVPTPRPLVASVGTALEDVARPFREGFERSGGATGIKIGGPVRSPVLVGLAALWVPRSIGQSLGLFEIAGGRRLWIFADVDTLVLDLALVGAVWYLLKGLRSPRRVFNPIVMMVLVWTVGIAIPLAYVVTNYGTLFRLREMVFVGICLIPLAASLGKPGPLRGREPARTGSEGAGGPDPDTI